MSVIPAEQITAAAVAIHDADCPDTHCSGSALGHAYKLARVALEAAAPLIAAAEREQIIQLAIAEAERQETANFSTVDTICGATLRDFAELLGGQS